MLKRIFTSVFLSTLIFASISSSKAATVTWTGSSDFESQQIFFTPFMANQLTDITENDFFGRGGYAHSHGGSMTFSISILLDSVWTPIFSQTLSGGAEQDLNLVATPINFTQGQVSGLWLDSSPFQFNSFHDFHGCLDAQCSRIGGDTQFVFSNVANSVPEPETTALLGIGLLGFVLTRRRSAKGKNT